MEKSLEAHLYECLKEGNTKKALYIVKLLGDDVDRLYGAVSLLVIAKKFNNIDVIEALEEKGAKEIISLREVERLGEELIDSAMNGDLDKVENLIEAGANVNLQSKDGYTALIWASKYGYVEIVEKLIEAGANVNIKNKEGQNAWMISDSDMRALIIEKVQEKKAKDKEDEPSVKDKIKGFFGKGDK